MAWEWIAPASGALVAVVGVGAGLVNTRWSQQSQRALMAEQRVGAHADEHRRWLRERRADAYVEILRLAVELGSVIHDPALMATGSPHDLRRRLQPARAAVVAYGSEEVRNLVLEWRIVTMRALKCAEERPPGKDLDVWQNKEYEIRAALGDAIRNDLSDPDA